jgi:hypothetical protein
MRHFIWPAIVGLSIAALAGASAAPAPAAPPAVSDQPFADVPRDHWAFEAVEELRKRGILRGYPPAPRPARAKRAPSPGKERAGKPTTPRG